MCRHLPLHLGAASLSGLMWNYEEVMRVVHRYGRRSGRRPPRFAPLFLHPSALPPLRPPPTTLRRLEKEKRERERVGIESSEDDVWAHVGHTIFYYFVCATDMWVP